jgi:Zn-dependent protease with chaperone function
MYELLLICLTLTTLLTVNALLSFVAGALGRLFAPVLQKLSASLRAEILFTLRLGAPVITIIAIAAVLVPSFLTHEPYGTNERVGLAFGLLTLISATGVGLALSRAQRSWFATRALLHKWLKSATPIQLAGVETPTYRIPHEFPVIAVVGSLKPRLFISERVLELLTPDELGAAIGHEAGHLAAHDNLKRSLLRACRDLLMLMPCGRSLDRDWATAAEEAADEHAALQSALTAVNLASALVKIAKIVPVRGLAPVPAGVFFVGIEEGRGVKGRVRRLLALASENNRVRWVSPFAAKTVPAAVFCFLLAAGIAFANSAHVLSHTHALYEHVVRMLT